MTLASTEDVRDERYLVPGLARGLQILGCFSRQDRELTGAERPDQRVAATVAANVLAFERGASVFRVHDVRATVDGLKLASATLARDGC